MHVCLDQTNQEPTGVPKGVETIFPGHSPTLLELPELVCNPVSLSFPAIPSMLPQTPQPVPCPVNLLFAQILMSLELQSILTKIPFGKITVWKK